jgi:hypothetical protein
VNQSFSRFDVGAIKKIETTRHSMGYETNKANSDLVAYTEKLLLAFDEAKIIIMQFKGHCTCQNINNNSLDNFFEKYRAL